LNRYAGCKSEPERSANEFQKLPEQISNIKASLNPQKPKKDKIEKFFYLF
jgi:hypothetical protein